MSSKYVDAPAIVKECNVDSRPGNLWGSTNLIGENAYSESNSQSNARRISGGGGIGNPGVPPQEPIGDIFPLFFLCFAYLGYVVYNRKKKTA